jgi:hypothetical protein
MKYGEQTLGRNLCTDINNGVHDEELRYALYVVLQQPRPELFLPTDPILVQQDVSDTTTYLKSSDATPLFNILLRRSDPHILAIGMSYGMVKLDRDIDNSNSLSNTAKKVLLHALRTAYNPAYRDAVLLHDSMGGSSAFGRSNDEKLGIRVCRMHWARDSWVRTRQEYGNITRKEFLMKMSRRGSGTFTDLLVAMASI